MKKYQLNVRPVNRKKRNRSLLIYASLILFILLLIALTVKFLLLPKTKINHPKAVVSQVSATTETSNLKTYSAANFSFKMSPGWTSVAVKNSPYHLYEWQYGSGSNYQTIDIFEDSQTSNFAVNKVIIVEPSGNHISVLGPPSDNCANFTNGTKTSTQTGYPAKWMGVSFLCDLNTTTSDTIGISSAAQINSVTLTNSNNARHSFYFLYTDHAITPNYTDLNDLLDTFTLQ